MKKKKILITGSNGLLGQKLVQKLYNNPNYELLATSLGENRIEKIKDFSYQSLNITSKKEVDDIIGNWQPDVVINTAAMTNVDACEDAKEQCWDINVNAVSYLFEACKKNKAHFIHLSTDFVFDGEAGPYKETDKPNPLSYYAKSKLASEEILLNSDYDNYAIARTIIVFGTADNMSRGNVVLWAKGALEKGQPINVVDDQFRAPTLAEDLADGCILIAENGAKGIYHLSGKDIMSILELVYQVADFYELDKSVITPIKTATLNQTAARPPKTGFILDKAIHDLGYAPHSFKESLKILDAQLTR